MHLLRKPVEEENVVNSKLAGGECLACYGNGVIVIEDPAFPEKRQPPVCPNCRGSGRLVEGRSIVADLWEGFKAIGPKR
jgi:DnaJ-class molecular chaperone